MKKILFIALLLIPNVAQGQGLLGNLFNYRQPKQVIDIVGKAIPDTVNAATEDSCDVWGESDFTLPSEYSTYLVVKGNGSASLSKATLATTYYPVDTKGTKLTFWAKATDDTVTTNRIDVWFASGDSLVVAEEDSIQMVDDATWEKHTVTMSKRLTGAMHSLVIKVYCKDSNTFYISPFYVE